MLRRKENQEKFSSFYNLRDATAAGECPLCVLTRKAETTYFDSLLYENVNDPGVREKLNESFGFCRSHALQLLSFGDAVGTAILYSGVFQQIRNAIEKKAVTPVGKIPAAKGNCPACDVKERHETHYLRELCTRLSDQEMREALSDERSSGLCVPHFNKVMEKIHNDEERRWLLSLQTEKYKHLRTTLKEFVRKQDVQFRRERTSQEEEDSCRKALNIVVGTIG